MLKEISEKLKLLPSSPGVYQMKDRSGKILYIGKTRDLSKRVPTYFRRTEELYDSVRRMVAHIRDIEWIITETEYDALILEANMIHSLKPRYNIELKENRRFFYIRVTTSEEFPRAETVRKIKKDGNRYFGPYKNIGSMKNAMKAIRQIFRLCDRQNRSGNTRRCLNYQMGQCMGICIEKNGAVRETYKKEVSDLLLFLSGKTSKLIENIRERMKRYSEKLEFEMAAAERNKLEVLERLSSSRQKVDLLSSDENADIIAVEKEGGTAAAVVMAVREGMLLGRSTHELKIGMEESYGAVMERFIEAYYHSRNDDIPALYTAVPPENKEMLEKYLSEKMGTDIQIKSPSKGPRAGIINLAERNARLVLDETLIRKKKLKERTSYAVECLKKELDMDKLPILIEGYDISHISGTNIVASGVCFENGVPKKSRYRKYSINTLEDVDDFAAMREVLDRRFRRMLDENGERPDLILIDGGKGQLSSAVEVMNKYGIEDIAVASLAKRLEEVYVPGKPRPLLIGKTSGSLSLLQNIRNEAHRFAVSFHRKKRKTGAFRSELDDIPGIGPKIRDSLLKTFGTVEKIKSLSAQELRAARGVSEKLSKIIAGHFKKF